MAHTHPPTPPSPEAGGAAPSRQAAPFPEPLGNALATVTRLVSGIAEALDLPATLQAALDAVRDVLAADIGTIRLLEDPPGELVLAASAGLTGDESANLPSRVPLDGDSLSARVARSRVPIRLGRMDGPPERSPAARWRLGLASVLGVPLVVRDRLLGTLLVGARRPHAFGADAEKLALAIAQVVAPALDRAALLDEVERLYAGVLQAKTRADALAEIGRALASARALNAVLDVIVGKTLAATESEACGIYAWDAPQDAFRPMAMRGLSAAFRREFAMARHEGLSGLVLRGGQPVWTADILTDPRLQFSPRARDLIAAEGFRSLLAVPIRLRAEFFGTLVTYRWRLHQFSEEEVRFQAALADQAAVAIESARLFEAQREAARNAERQRARAEALATVGQALSASLDLDEVLALLVGRTAGATGADAVAVMEREPATGVLRFRRAHGLSARYREDLALPPGAGLSGAVLAAGQPQWTADLLADPRISLPDDVQALVAAEGIRGFLAVPVRGSAGYYGTLALYWRAPHPFDEEEIAFAVRIADQAALAIENARLYGQAQARLETIQRQHAAAQALLEVSQTLTQTLDLELVFDLIAEKVLAVTGADACGIARLNPAGHLEYVRAKGFHSPDLLHMTLLRGEGLMGRCLEVGTPLWSRDLRTDPTITYRPETRARTQMRGGLAIPIVTSDGPYGILFIGRRQVHDHRPQEIAFAEALAAQAAIAIQNAGLYEQEQARRRQVEAVRAVTEEITRELDLPRLLGLIQRHAVDLVGAAVGTVYLWDEASQALVPQAWQGLGDWIKDVRVRLGEGLTGIVAQRQKGMIVNDYRSWPNANPVFLRHTGMTAGLAEPLLYRGRLVGVITVNDAGNGRAFTPQDLETLGLFAGHAAIAIENAWLYEESQRRAREATALAEVGRFLSSSLDMDRVLELIVQQVQRAMGVPFVGIMILDEGRHELAYVKGAGLRPERMARVRLKVGEGIAGRAVAQGVPVQSPNLVQDQRYASPGLAEAEGFRSLLCAPLLAQGRPLGALAVFRQDEHEFVPSEVQLLASFADQAALAIENARLYEGALRTAEEIAALSEAGQAITESLDLDTTLGQIAESARHLAEADRAFVWLVDPQDGSLRAGIASGPGAETFVGTRLPADSPAAAARAAWEGRPLAVENALDPAAGADPGLSARFGNAALLAIPLRVQASIPGVLVCGYNAPRAFAGAEVDRLMGLAQQAAIAIQNARLFQQEQERRRQLEAVRAVSAEIIRELDLSTLLGLIQRKAMELVRATAGAVHLWNEADQVLVPQVWHGLGDWVRELRVRPGEGLAGAVAQRREGLIANDYRNSPYALSLARGRSTLTAALAEPLLYRDRLVGVVIVGDQGTGRTFTAQHRETLSLFAAQAAIAIENARLYAETRKAYEDLQAAQEQLVQIEKLRALGEMAGGVAHDFNNLLAAILGRAQLLRLRAEDPQVRDGLAVIEHAALDGAETVRRILGFARVRSEAHYAPVDLGALIPQVLEVTRPRWKDEAQGRGAAIEAVVAVEPVPAVLGNAAELREVLVNLVFNAVDAMPQGGRLTIGARRLLRPSRTAGAVNPHRETFADEAHRSQELVEVFVRDTGIGMSDDVRRRAFEPFFTTKGVKGSGLGLSMAYGIVTRHGGEVLLESQKGAGTTVTLRLPATDRAVADLGRPVLPPAARAGRIVVVDDEEVLGEALADLLRLHHHRVHAFSDPRRALEHLAREPADLLFTDLGMPEMSGWDVARSARDLQPALPIVLVTGWGHGIDPAQVRQRRVDAVVAKPFRVEDILHVVAELLPAAPAG